MIIEYIKRLLTKWFGKFTLITSISSFILFYTNIDTRDLIVNIISSNLLYVSLIFLFIATYQAWRDIRLEKQELENKLKNPINYEIKALVKKVKVDIHYLETIFNKKIEESKQLISKVDYEINKLSAYENDNFISNQLDVLKSLTSTLSGMDNYQKTDKLYLNELISYKKQLEEYPSLKEDYLSKWEIFVANDLKNIYFIDFTIMNIGNKSDEDIDIQILYENNNKYVGNPNLMDNFPRQHLPTKPERSYNNLIPVLHGGLDNQDLHESIMNSNPQVYKRYETIEENNFSIKIRDLKVSETIRIFKQKGFFINVENTNDFSTRIVSKNSTSAIKKKIMVEECGEYDYFKEN